MGTETIAKRLHDLNRGRPQFRRGQLVIVDEASLAGTLTLHRLAAHTAGAGAKLLLVGDPAQLSAIEAGAAFTTLVDDRVRPPELTQVRRFVNDWGAAASLQLRRGDPGCLKTYAKHGRLHTGPPETMLEQAYQAWFADTRNGLESLLIAPTSNLVDRLNDRARADGLATGQIAADGEVPLRGGSHASVGDVIVTRRNNRRLLAGRTWVRNGDRWTITANDPGGGITAQLLRVGASVRLPADYVADHVDLGYATTIHQSQGATVDTTHAITTQQTTRAQLYVALIRGRRGNTLHHATLKEGPLARRELLELVRQHQLPTRPPPIRGLAIYRRPDRSQNGPTLR